MKYVLRPKLINFLFIICLCSNLVFGQKIVRGPYLQQVSRTEAFIRWRTDIPTNTMVEYISTEGKFIKNDESLSINHSIQLTNLQPNTRYAYAVGYSGKLFSSEYFYFTTAPITQKSVKIWAMGDFGDNSKEVYAQNQLAVKNAYLQKIKSASDIWLWLGDNAYCCGTDQQYQKLVFDVYGDKILPNTPFYAVPGNHEYLETTTAQKDRKISYFDMITVPQKAEMGGVVSNSKAYYSFNYANIHFIALDSYGLDDGFRLYDARSKQYQWLLNDLEANKSEWTIIFFHHPPYTKRSHNSDGEEELRLIRENLVPVFDKFNVDLVLNGHSHIYERSFLMKGHTGKSPTFDYQTHVVQKVDGKYIKNGSSAPFINKTEGTIYTVVGSAGRLDWSGDPDPHVSSQYSNVNIGGSLLLNINQNRLDAAWLCADGQIRDEFTIFKDVNKKQNLSIKYGEKIRLTASWQGSYRWNISDSKQKTIEIQPLNDFEVIVQDSLGFLEDKFKIHVIPPPIIKTSLKQSNSVCAGSMIEATFEELNTVAGEKQYNLELSDNKGSFENKLILGTSNKSPFTIQLPNNLPEGAGYKIRFVPILQTEKYLLQTSEEFQINQLASGGFTQSIIPYDTLVTLKLKLNGTFPIKFTINQLDKYEANKFEFNIQRQMPGELVYRLTSLENICGKGNITLQDKLVIEAPLALENRGDKYQLYPNPVNRELILDNLNHVITSGEQLIIVDESGKFMKEFQRTDNKIILENFPSGIYYLLIINGESKKKSYKFLKH